MAEWWKLVGKVSDFGSESNAQVSAIDGFRACVCAM